MGFATREPMDPHTLFFVVSFVFISAIFAWLRHVTPAEDH
jgi:hypothetical protein